MSWYKKAMGKEHDYIQNAIKTFPKESINDIANQIINDVINYYQTGESFQTQDYKLKQDYNDHAIQNYYVNVGMIPSNNSTYVDSGSQHEIFLKILNKNILEDRRTTADKEISRISRGIRQILEHEMGHFYVQEKVNNKRSFDYYNDGFKSYFDDPEEVVMHSQDIWNELTRSFKNGIEDIKTLSPENILGRLKRAVDYLPVAINAPRKMKATQKNIFLRHIWKTYVKPIFGVPMPK